MLKTSERHLRFDGGQYFDICVSNGARLRNRMIQLKSQYDSVHSVSTQKADKKSRAKVTHSILLN